MSCPRLLPVQGDVVVARPNSTRDIMGTALQHGSSKHDPGCSTAGATGLKVHYLRLHTETTVVGSFVRPARAWLGLYNGKSLPVSLMAVA